MQWCRTFATAICLFTPNLLAADPVEIHGLQQASEIHRALTTRPDKRVARIWSGTEILCVIAQRDHADQVLNFISALNLAFHTEFNSVNVVNHSACPSSTSFFILAEGNPTPERLSDVLEDIHGTRPPPGFFMHGVWGGFSLTLPEIPAREFVFFNTLSQSVHSNPLPSVSIMLEEMLHSFTGLSDLPSNQIYSLLGEDTDVVDYGHWFTKNPKGLCTADLYLLEMAIGPNVRATAFRTTSLEWFSDHQEAIDSSVANAKLKLSDFLDPRCT